MKLPFVRPEGKKFRLAKIDTAPAEGHARHHSALEAALAEERPRLHALQERLWAEGKRSVLVVLQGMDTSGKDGLIRHVFTGLNPSGVVVTGFKVPSEEERSHDFLWRIHKAAPRAGTIAVFNRSHYEDVLVVRVHSLVPKEIWKARYDRIIAFEKQLSGSGVRILKFFLHVSKGEQKRRLEARLADPEHRWKFNPGDLDERKLWGDYQAAYEEALDRCNTQWAPWHVVPADSKPLARLLVARSLRKALEEMDPKPPAPSFDWKKIRVV